MKTYISILVCVITASLFSCLDISDIEAEKREIAKEKKYILSKNKASIMELSKTKMDTMFYWIVKLDDGTFAREDTHGKYNTGEKITFTYDENDITVSIVRLDKMVIDTIYYYKTMNIQDSIINNNLTESRLKLKRGDNIAIDLD